MIQAKIQIEPEDYEFIKRTHRELRYKSFSEYVRDAVAAKVKKDRKRLREKKRLEAMAMIGGARYENLFESIEGENFEDR